MHIKTVTNYIHVMKYMGSKRELLEQIEKIIAKHVEPGDIILDLFSGTCGVGTYLRDKYPIYSNDIQLYSKVISEGTIEIPNINISKEQIWLLLEDNYLKNYSEIKNRLKEYFTRSSEFIKINKWDEKKLQEYRKFIKKAPYPGNNNGMLKQGQKIIETYKKKKSNKSFNEFPYFQTTALFSEMYFSFDQAASIDSLVYAIDNLSVELTDLASILRVALIHAYSYTSAGTGHFAQFRDLSTISSINDVFLYRTRSVVEYFLRKSEEIVSVTKLNRFYKQSRSFALDYRDILNNKKIMKRVSAVYADPPYSFVHYSRFYHAIEDLCRYDYPEVQFKGRYRMDRHQSPFCIKTQASNAFDTLLRSVKPYNIPILISYSNTGMIALDQIYKIANDLKYKTSLVEISHKHSTMGRLKDRDRKVTEALILCS